MRAVAVRSFKPNFSVSSVLAVVILVAAAANASASEADLKTFVQKHCVECHDAETKKGDLDLTALPLDFAKADVFARWVKVHDQIATGQMPPKKKARPDAAGSAAVTAFLRTSLVDADRARMAGEVRTGIRRLTRAEYENTLRDLFDLPGVALQGDLPADGSAHGFDNNADALDISHVNLAQYVAVADRLLDIAIAKQAEPPAVKRQRISLVNPAGFVAHISMNGDAVLLKNKQPDPEYPPAGLQHHIDQGAHERWGSFHNGASVGVFRHEDESVSPYFNSFVAIYPGKYRIKTSFWSFTWDKGKVLPGRGTEAARLSCVQLTADGRGGQHPSYVIGYYDAPSLQEKEHEFVHYFNKHETVGFNAASLAPVVNYSRKGRAMAFTGPGIAVDYLDVEGPLYESWPPAAHKLLFGELPIVEFTKDAFPGAKPPARKPLRQEMGCGKNQPDPLIKGVWTVRSDKPLDDADRLLANFLPRAFRRPVPDDLRKAYVAKVGERLDAGDCFEVAMRWAYRAALTSPDFLYRVEPAGQLDQFALASRLSYFLWNSAPDERLVALATAGKLADPAALRAEVERMLADPKSKRFVEDFPGQWLKLRSIAANDADRKLYPEFSPYLQDSMVAETRGYFRELLDRNLPATYLVKSDFAMINQKLATHYGIPGVVGAQVRPVAVPAGCPRGPFLTQAAILKVTANGTTTSPVPRGAFVEARLLGRPPEPPPPNVAAVEPDVQGATTIRELLDKHRNNPTCASCHAKIDPPGFALESFDVIGGYRERYRSIGGAGDTPDRGSIDPFIGIQFKLGKPVDPSGALPDGRPFAGISQFQDLLAADPRPLLRNLAEQLSVYSTGRGLTFSDRDAIDGIVASTAKQGGGVRTLIHEVVQSPLFQTR
jgi:mono/diheme cytochrome c family protein